MSSWQEVAGWYDSAVGYLGHTFHQEVIFPKLIPLLALQENDRVLDIGCGQGVLARKLPKQIAYLGIDASSELIARAKEYDKSPRHTFLVHDAVKPLSQDNFSHAVFLLSLQNMENPKKVLENASQALMPKGKVFLILNHPCFRIPRQTSWGEDEKNKMQYRRINRYMTPLKIPITTHPSKKEASKTTLSFHYPLSSYTSWLYNAGLSILFMEEWVSEKKSSGKKARQENLARSEFPLFLLICAGKAHSC